jgi:glucokinase
MSQRSYYVGLDVGGTTMKAAVVDETGKPHPSVTLPTEPQKGQEAGLETMCRCIRECVQAAGLQMSDIAAIGVATPGPMDIPAGMILDPANLKPWKNVPVRQYIADHFKLPTAYQNDANAAALGEYWVGAGHDVKSMVLFTLGTGVGGGIIMDDRVLEGRHSHGGELGHMTIRMTDGRLCGCGRRGCLEAYGSATSTVKRAKEALAQDGGKSALHAVMNANSGNLTGKDIFVAGAAGDELANQVIDETAYYLAVGAANLMHIIDPDMIVFGGGMAVGDDFLNRIRKYVKENALPLPAEKTVVRFAQLGSNAGFIGSAACGRLLVNNGKLT